MRAETCRPGFVIAWAITASASASCGNSFGGTNDVTSIARTPAAYSASIQASLVSVGITSAIDCKPSRMPTSRRITLSPISSSAHLARESKRRPTRRQRGGASAPPLAEPAMQRGDGGIVVGRLPEAPEVGVVAQFVVGKGELHVERRAALAAGEGVELLQPLVAPLIGVAQAARAGDAGAVAAFDPGLLGHRLGLVGLVPGLPEPAQDLGLDLLRRRR